MWNNMKHFFWRGWQRILPLVYDDSLSLYEVVAKLVCGFNKAIDRINEFGNALKQFFEDLENGKYNGEQGPQGPVGPEGPRGVQGPQGPVGPTGAQGPQGIQGIKGDPGAGLGIKGTVSSVDELPETGEDGDAYGVGSEYPYDVYIYQGGEWINYGPLEGPIGPQGEQGPQGPVGPQGPQGERGLNGTNGVNGIDGKNGTSFTIKGIVGSTQNLPAVPNEGDAYGVGESAPYDIYTWTGSEWVNLGPIMGPEGESGLSMSLLWTNPNPSEDFEGLTVELPHKYRAYIIAWNGNTIGGFYTSVLYDIWDTATLPIGASVAGIHGGIWRVVINTDSGAVEEYHSLASIVKSTRNINLGGCIMTDTVTRQPTGVPSALIPLSIIGLGGPVA